MKKDNIWNRLFHKKALQAQKAKLEECKALVGLGPETLQFIQAATTLEKLLEAHKKAWNRGYRNKNLGPCEYGMFRTQDIATMTPSEVFLGNIYGLWTFAIPNWKQDTDGYKIVMSQYRTLLRRNVEKIIYDAREFIKNNM